MASGFGISAFGTALFGGGAPLNQGFGSSPFGALPFGAGPRPSLEGFGSSPFGALPFGAESIPDQVIDPLGIGSAESVGVPVVAVALAQQTVAIIGIESAEAFGLPVVTSEPVPTGSIHVVVYSAAREGFLDGSVDWDTGVIKASLVRSYVFSDTHRYVSDMTAAGGSVVATATLIDKDVTNGIADAGDTTFEAVPASAAIPAAVLFQSSAATGGVDVAPSAQRLVGFIDLSTGALVVPNGSDITLAWSSDRNRIFML